MAIWNRPKKRGKLIYEYLLLMMAVGVIILLSFLATAYIANESAMEQSRQSVEVIFQQAEDGVKIFEEDVSNLYINVVNNASTASFFRAENLSGRWDRLSEFHQVVGNNMRINQSLKNIQLYDKEG